MSDLIIDPFGFSCRPFRNIFRIYREKVNKLKYKIVYISTYVHDEVY